MAQSVRAGEVGALLRAAEAERMRRLRAAIRAAAEESVEIIREALPKDTGALRASVRLVERPDGDFEVRVEAPYAGDLEIGSRPRQVALGPLVEWVKRHRSFFGLMGAAGFQGTGLNTARGRAGQDPGQAAAVRIARAIQAKIAREGSPPHWYVRGTLPAQAAALKRHLQAAR